jgi:glycosyltransferase involved in cell wall biosynthesis
MHGIINASAQEWLPTWVIEWLLAQCVVVATRVGWTPEISDQDDLILIEPGQIDALVEWMKKAIYSYKFVAGLSRILVSKKFDWSQNITFYKAFFDSL